MVELTKLKEKSFLEVKLNSIGHGIPILPPPKVFNIYCYCFVWRIHRNNISSCCITCSFIEVSFISKTKSPLLPTVRTESRMRDLKFFSIKNRWDFVIEVSVFLVDRENFRALFAGFIFDNIIHILYNIKKYCK